MDWQTRSPDLNQIEHIWNEVQDKISARQLEAWSNVGPKMDSHTR
jgi:hypothetical protein